MDNSKIQNLLPFGYLFLVIIGILKETVFFYQIGIPILKYSSIIDILISPVATMTSHLFILLFIMIVFYFCFQLPKFLIKQKAKPWMQKRLKIDVKVLDLPEKELNEFFVFYVVNRLAVFLLSFFLGFGIAEGGKFASKIKNNKLDFDYKLNYASGESELISIISSNSSYYFYVSKGSKNIKIAPSSSVKNIEFINNKRLNVSVISKL